MKTIIFILILCLCFEFGNGAVFDPYQRRYNIRNASFDALFPTTAPAGFQKLINSSTVIDNTRCKNIHQFTTSSTLDQLANFHHELIDLCPQLYDTIKSKNISTWGPVDEFLQIWYTRFVDALWIKIQARTCRCQLYDDFVYGAQASSDAALLQYLETNYDPSLCEINDQTMYKWNLFLNKPEIKNRAVKFIRIGSFSIPTVHEIAKAYLTETRYNMYFEGPPFLLNFYYNATFTSPNWTLTMKGYIKQMINYYDQKFPPMNIADRQNQFSMKHCESLDISWSYYDIFNRIPLDPTDEITNKHLVLYLCQKQFLNAKRQLYASSPTTPICTTTTQSTTTTTTTEMPTTTSPCISDTVVPPGTAGIFLGEGVELGGWYEYYGGKKDPLGTCGNTVYGVLTYYDGNTPSGWDNFYNTSAGYWDRKNCTSPCICTAEACYLPVAPDYDYPTFPDYPGDPEGPDYPEAVADQPFILLYPHCNTTTDCFVAATFGSGGYLVNPLNSSDKYNPYGPWDVNDPSIPKVTKVGCKGCPVIT